MPIEPFSIDIHDDVLSDLRARIRGTRWPDQVSGLSWEQGTELGYLRETLAYWADGFDWPAAQRELNSFEHVRVDLGDATVHCVHTRAKGGGGIPPSSGRVHVVRQNETLFRIALQYGTTVAQLAAINGIANPNLIYIDQRIALP